MDEPTVWGNEELRRKILRYRGVRPKKKKRSDIFEKSTEFHLSDILLLSKINNEKRFYDFIMGRTTFGPVVRARLTKVVMTLDSGCATKSQFGVYHFYDKPVVPPKREMTISFGSGGIKMGVQSKPDSPKMPAFMEIFKGD